MSTETGSEKQSAGGLAAKKPAFSTWQPGVGCISQCRSQAWIKTSLLNLSQIKFRFISVAQNSVSTYLCDADPLKRFACLLYLAKFMKLLVTYGQIVPWVFVCS